MNGFDHAGEAGWPNWRELHKQRKCPAGEETSYLPQLHTFSPLVFCIANTQKKLILNSGLVGHLIDWKPIFLPVAKENIPKRAIFHLVSNLI